MAQGRELQEQIHAKLVIQALSSLQVQHQIPNLSPDGLVRKFNLGREGLEQFGGAGEDSRHLLRLGNPDGQDVPYP